MIIADNSLVRANIITRDFIAAGGKAAVHQTCHRSRRAPNANAVANNTLANTERERSNKLSSATLGRKIHTHTVKKTSFIIYLTCIFHFSSLQAYRGRGYSVALQYEKRETFSLSLFGSFCTPAPLSLPIK